MSGWPVATMRLMASAAVTHGQRFAEWQTRIDDFLAREIAQNDVPRGLGRLCMESREVTGLKVFRCREDEQV